MNSFLITRSEVGGNSSTNNENKKKKNENDSRSLCPTGRRVGDAPVTRTTTIPFVLDDYDDEVTVPVAVGARRRVPVAVGARRRDPPGRRPNVSDEAVSQRDNANDSVLTFFDDESHEPSSLMTTPPLAPSSDDVAVQPTSFTYNNNDEDSSFDSEAGFLNPSSLTTPPLAPSFVGVAVQPTSFTYNINDEDSSFDSFLNPSSLTTPPLAPSFVDVAVQQSSFTCINNDKDSSFDSEASLFNLSSPLVPSENLSSDDVAVQKTSLSHNNNNNNNEDTGTTELRGNIFPLPDAKPLFPTAAAAANNDAAPLLSLPTYQDQTRSCATPVLPPEAATARMVQEESRIGYAECSPIPGSAVSNRFANITHKDLIEVLRAVIAPIVVLAICLIEMRSGLSSLVHELTLLVKWSVWFGILAFLIIAVLFSLLHPALPPSLQGGRESRDESDKVTRTDRPVGNSAAHTRHPRALVKHEQHDRLQLSGSGIHMDDSSCSSSVSCSRFNNDHDTSDVAPDAQLSSICSIEPFGPNADLSPGRIFINHTGQDSGARILAEMIWRDLRQEGYSCFFDAKSLNVGDKFEKCIEMHVQACDIFLCIVSEEWYYRHWCMRELNIACESKRKIIPVFMECGKVHYDDDFRGKFYGRHLFCKKNRVKGALIDQFWNNVINLQEIQTDRTINWEGKGDLFDNVNIIKLWIIREMQRQQRRHERSQHHK
jgi:hypothetical protein